MNIRSKLLILIGLLTFSSIYGKDIDLICSGTGQTRDEAINNALVNAIEQTCGSFVSANTTILNDNLVKDELVSLKKGSIKKYKIVSDYNPNSQSVIIEAKVSPEKITQFVESKGSEAELAGDTFGANVKLYKLNLSNAVIALEHLFQSLAGLSKMMYDYKIEIADPILVDKEAWVPVVVRCVLNKNGIEFYRTYNQTAHAIYNTLKHTRPAGVAVYQDIDKVNDTNLMCQFLPILQCFGFTISDNIGSNVYTHLAMNRPVESNPFTGCWPRRYLGTDYEECNPNYAEDYYQSRYKRGQTAAKPILPWRKIEFFDGRRVSQDNKSMREIDGIRLRIDSRVISVRPLGQEPYDDELWTYKAKMAKVHMQNQPGAGNDFLWALENRGYGFLEIPFQIFRNYDQWFGDRYSKARLGEVNGSVHMVLQYPVDKIEEVSKISVTPNRDIMSL